jgi:hypothetical protein
MGRRYPIGRHPHRLMSNSTDGVDPNPKMAGKTTKELPVDSNRGPSWQAPRVGNRQRIRSRLGSLGAAKF